MALRRRVRPGPLYLIGGFLGLIAAGTALLLLPIASRDGGGADFTTALFTATSAVCVTGLVVVDTYNYWSPFGQVVILILIQLGGLGFMTSATLLFLILGRRLSFHERLLTGETIGRVGPGWISALVTRMVIISLVIEAAGAIVLMGLFTASEGELHSYDLWRGLFLAVSAFNNAGFDVEGDFHSLTALTGSPSILGSTAILAFTGSVGFAVWTDISLHRG